MTIPVATSPRFDAAALQRALAVRGLSGADLARLAKISHPTVSQALRGRPVAMRSFSAIVRALSETDPLPGSSELIADSDGLDWTGA